MKLKKRVNHQQVNHLNQVKRKKRVNQRLQQANHYQTKLNKQLMLLLMQSKTNQRVKHQQANHLNHLKRKKNHQKRNQRHQHQRVHQIRKK